MKVFVCALMLCIAAPSWAQEFLEPDDAPIIAGEPSRLFGRDYGQHLKPAIDDTVRVFDVIEGGLVPDFVVGLKAENTGYRIFSFMAGKTGNHVVNRCEAPIDDSLARDIVLAWNKVLRQMRPRKGQPMGGPDVPFHHFGTQVQGHIEIGRVWETPPTSNPAYLGRIAGGLLQICSPNRVQPVPEALAEIRITLGLIH